MDLHECGTARMGQDPATSVLDPYNQCWDARGLYVTDSASFPSQAAQNPTLTLMALTARACAHALLGGHSTQSAYNVVNRPDVRQSARAT
jgi:choline dehydrogenase-like flavoprotein